MTEPTATAALTATSRGVFDRALSRSVDRLFEAPNAPQLLADFLAGDRVIVIGRDGLACLNPQEAAEMFGGPPAPAGGAAAAPEVPAKAEPRDEFRPGFYL